MAIQNGSQESFILRVNDVISSKLKDEEFGVSELARELSMSRSNLHRKIKSGTGLSVSRYIRNARLSKAMERLCNDFLTVAETAYLTGFKSATYFSKCFREHYGYPPVEARNRISDAADLKGSNHLHNFPVQTTSFIGRELEMETIEGLISQHRIVTLTGTGGCGKTRLACELLAKPGLDFADGIWFVDLAPLEREEHVEKRLINALGLTGSPDRELMEIISDGIKEKRLLILLDNCEHLLGTAAGLAQKLVQSAPDLTLLVTSREALNIKGEKVWRVPSLSLADPSDQISMEQAKASEAVSLFIERAKLSNSGFELVKENAFPVSSICHRLDGIPLAIELVASRSRYLDTITMLNLLQEKIDTLPSLNKDTVDRQKTIQATIEWSYNLLSQEEKELFYRLSVFAGGFDLSAVKAICLPEQLPVEGILDLLSALVDKSMIQIIYKPAQQIRYKMLETLKRYGFKQLEENGEAKEILGKHLGYFTRIANNAYEEQFEAQSEWADRLEMDWGNILSALNWSESINPEQFVQLIGYLGWFWRLKADVKLGMNYYKRAITNHIGSPENHARVLLGLGMLTWVSGDSKNAVSHLQQSLDIWRKADIPKEIAFALSELSEPLLQSGNREASIQALEEALEIARELGEPGLINHCLNWYCTGLVHTKQFEKGEPLVLELLSTSENLGNILGFVSALHYLADCALGRNDFLEAEKRYIKGIETALENKTPWAAAFDVQGLAFAISGQGRYPKSVRLDAASREQFKRLGIEVDGMFGFWDEWIDNYIEVAKRELGVELTKKYQEEGVAMGFERAVEYALDTEID
jgi:predicted ATPase/AraC-like DNA-binding protein